MRTLLVITCIYWIHAWDIVLKGPDRVKIGKSFSLLCNATDLETKPESIVWFKGYDKLLPDDRISITNLASLKALASKLTIKHATKQDEGKYKCWLSNDRIRQKNVVVEDGPHSGADSGTIVAQIPTVLNLIFIIVINWLGQSCLMGAYN